MWKETAAITVIASLGAFGVGSPGPALGRIDIQENDMWQKPLMAAVAIASLGLLGAQEVPAQTADANDARQEDRQADRQQDRRADRRQDRRMDRRDDATDRPERIERAERAERPERAERTERAERVESPDRSGRR